MAKEKQPNSVTRIEQCFLFPGQFSAKAMKWNRARYTWEGSERQGAQEGAGGPGIERWVYPQRRAVPVGCQLSTGEQRASPCGRVLAATKGDWLLTGGLIKSTL